MSGVWILTPLAAGLEALLLVCPEIGSNPCQDVGETGRSSASCMCSMWRLEDLLGDQRGTSCSPGSMLWGEIVPLSEEDQVLSWGNEDPPWSGMERVRALGRGQGEYLSCWRGVVGSLSSAMDSLLPWQVVIEWSSLSCWWLSEFELSS